MDASQIDFDPAPGADMAQATITIDDDGLTTIEIPGTGKEPPADVGPDADFDRNLAVDMDPGLLASLGAWLIESIEADEQDRSQWLQTVNEAAAFLGVDIVTATSSVSKDGTISDHVVTAMLEAALKMWAVSYGELLPAGGPVKTARLDPVETPDQRTAPDGQGLPEPGLSDQDRDDLAEQLQRDMNWYLTVGDRGYYPDVSKMLMNRNLIGLAFREIYRDPIERKPLSRWVMAQDFIVSGSPTHLSQAARTTVRKKIRQGVMRRMQKTGVYLDVPLVSPQGNPTETEVVIGETEGVTAQRSLPRDYEHEIYECSTEIGSHEFFEVGDFEKFDADEEGHKPGWALPYFITIDRDSRAILSIRRNWKKGDDQYKRKRRYVKFGGIPAFGGGFYDWGLLHIAHNPTHAATMLQRSSIDAAIFSNFPAWVATQGPGSRVENTVIRPNFGEIWRIPGTAGQDITKVMMAIPYKPPSAEAMAIQAKLEKDVGDLAGVIDIPVGEGRIGNTPVGTIMSYIESTTMVPGAIHKADHSAQAEEFELLRELLAEEPQLLWRGNKTPARKWQTAEELLAPDISPQADPNVPSQVHRLMKAQGLIMAGGLPQFNGIADNRAIYKRVIPVLAGCDSQSLEIPPPPPGAPPPPPDPKIVAAQIKAQSETQAAETEVQKAQIMHAGKMAEIQAEGQQRDLDRQSEETRSAMQMQAAKIKGATALANAHIDNAHDATQQHANRQVDLAKHVTPPAALPPPPAPDGATPEDVPQ